MNIPKQNFSLLRHKVPERVDRTKFFFSKKLRDIEVVPSLVHKMELSDEMAKQRHPLEYIADYMRAQENPYKSMTHNSLLMTNFPSGVEVGETLITDLVMKGDPSSLIKSIEVKHALVGDNGVAAQAAYAIVEFETSRSVENVRKGLRKHWIKDKLLKLRTLDDFESFNDRSIIVTNFPSHVKQVDLINAFQPFGAVTSVEIPTVDAVINSRLEENGALSDHYLK